MTSLGPPPQGLRTARASNPFRRVETPSGSTGRGGDLRLAQRTRACPPPTHLPSRQYPRNRSPLGLTFIVSQSAAVDARRSACRSRAPRTPSRHRAREAIGKTASHKHGDKERPGKRRGHTTTKPRVPDQRHKIPPPPNPLAPGFASLQARKPILESLTRTSLPPASKSTQDHGDSEQGTRPEAVRRTRFARPGPEPSISRGSAPDDPELVRIPGPRGESLPPSPVDWPKPAPGFPGPTHQIPGYRTTGMLVPASHGQGRWTTCLSDS